MSVLLRALTVSALAFLTNARLHAEDDGRASRPNVILIMVDDLGYQDLGCYGHASIRTPRLDRLAADGMRLTSFYCGASVCTPSRMALLTGAYPVRAGWVQGVAGFKMGPRDGLDPEALTLADIFQSEGYMTGIAGKWHIGHHPETRPHRRGFAHSYYIPLSNNQTDEIWRGDEVVEKPFDNRLLTERFADEAIRFIRGNHERPFFLYLPFTVPHFPVQPHPEWKGKSNFGIYGDVVEELDARLGTIFDTLAELGLRERTLVVFTSDNGPNPGEKSGCLPFRGEKWSALEGGNRVPCIVTWPGTIPAGQTSDAIVAAIDLLPTLSRACGIDWRSKSRGKPPIDGIDLWETMLGKPQPRPRAELLFWHGMDSGPQAIRSGDWKLFPDRRHAIEGMGTARATPEQVEKIAALREGLVAGAANPPVLFNLRDDPGETTDLSGGHPDVVKHLTARMEELVAEIHKSPTLPLHTPGQAK